MALGLGHKGGIFMFSVTESPYGTAVTRTKVVEMLPGESVKKEQSHMESAGLNSIIRDKDDVEKGRTVVGGDIPFELRYEGFEKLIEQAMGSSTSAEQASFVVEDTGGGQNNKIDFKEGGGDDQAATLTAGTYIMGADSSVDASLAKEIKTQLESTSLGTLTYTVTFDEGATNKLTIAVATSTFQILTDGTNTAISAHTLLGFTTNSADSSSVQGDTALVAVYQHTLSMADTLPLGMTMEVDMDTKSKLIEGGKIESINFEWEADGFLKMTIGIDGEDLTYDTPTTGLSLTTTSLIPFNEIVVTYDGAQDVRSGNVSLVNNLNKDRYYVGSLVHKEPLRSGTKPEVTGSISVDFEDSTEFDNFIALTEKDLVITATGDVIKTSLSYSIAITCKNTKLTSGVPSVGDLGLIPLDMPFRAYDTDTSTRALQIVIQNTLNDV